MADSLSESYETLADTDMWLDVAVLFAGFMAPTLVKNTIEGRQLFDAPDEAYGVIVIVLAELGLDEYRRQAQLGGGLYTVDKLAVRFELKSRLQTAGA